MSDDGNGGTPPGGGGGGGPGTVPYARFQEVVTARNDLQGRVTSLEGEVQTLTEKAATVDTLAGQVETFRGKAAAAEQRFERYQTISGELGTTDPDAIEAVEWQHGRLPEEGRPELKTWLADLKAKPEEAPTVLRPWLKSEEGGGAPGGEGGGDTTRKPRAPGRRAGGTPPGGDVTAAQIREASQHGQRTGDWSRYRELAEAAGLRKPDPARNGR